jgi:hypothetical protein
MASRLTGSLLAVALTAGIAGAAIAQPAYPPIPPPRVEVMPAAPGARFIWEPGHWRWTGVQYVWDPGHYIARRPHYAHYAPGHWAPRGGAWVWVPAHWE